MAGEAFDLNNLFEGSLRKLRVEAEYFSRSTNHKSELGRLNETHLVKMLRDYLPPKIGVGTGFIACGGSRPRRSPQCDIILFDALNNMPLYRSEAWSIYPIEMVYGVVEVKTKLTVSTLNDAFAKCSAIRQMAKTDGGGGNKSYLVQRPSQSGPEVAYDDLPPRFYVFAYGGWRSRQALERNFKKQTEANDSAHIHGVCCLNTIDSFYVRHLAYRPVSERSSDVSASGFRTFLMALPHNLNLMLPPERNGQGFDETNLGWYNLPEQS